MLARLFAMFQTRQSTAFLLARRDDRLLADIGLTRADLEAMHLGVTVTRAQQSDSRLAAQPFRHRLPA